MPNARLAVVALLASIFVGPVFAGGLCTPFGNAPRQMTSSSPAPVCAGGTVMGPWADGDGTPRYACLYAPAGANTPLPLVVFIHPSLVNADSIVATGLPLYQASANLSDDPAHQGFILLAPQGRMTTHFYPPPDDIASGWDNWYRQFAPGPVAIDGVAYPENVDAATLDHFIQAVIDMNLVNLDRVYLTGWSNGSAMAYLYALNRPNIAAIAVYSSPDPFGAFNDPCPQTPVRGDANADVPAAYRIVAPGVPTYEIHNDCDIAGLCPNSEKTQKQILAMGGSSSDLIINSAMIPANGCNALCGTNPNADPSSQLGLTLGTANHLRWPSNWTVTMLDFLRQHPLSARQPDPSAVSAR